MGAQKQIMEQAHEEKAQEPEAPEKRDEVVEGVQNRWSTVYTGELGC